ncbi:MAG TPA: C39 family peptidase [Bryobacteraceae bacterium]|nr:C39 family peptidase [Bryobacteraceae bacterium]
MSTPAATECSIPYERQSEAEGNRTCGAACLSMVYGSLGKVVAQDQIWPAISKPNRFGSLASTTHLMVRDALSHGFDAVAIQARHPLFVLRLCLDAGIRVILNHRLNPGTGTGHYTVLVDIDEHEVVLHDPYFGPWQRLSHADLLGLWQPSLPNSEIVGNTLIAIANHQPAEAECPICHHPIPAAVGCPQCKSPVTLRPVAPLGCINEGCIVRMWNYVCCPSCDYMWAFDVHPPEAAAEGAAPPAEEPAPDPFNFKRLFAELDRFCAAVVALPGAAGHTEIQQQIALLNSKKEELKQAGAQAIAVEKAQKEKMAAQLRESQQKAEAHRRKMEEINKPSPPLDGEALGRALLKNLGLTT